MDWLSAINMHVELSGRGARWHVINGNQPAQLRTCVGIGQSARSDRWPVRYYRCTTPCGTVPTGAAPLFSTSLFVVLPSNIGDIWG